MHKIVFKEVDEKFLKWLRSNHESRIPYTDYGSDAYKPFFGVLFEIGEMVYITQISSPKPRHRALKDLPDFHRIYNPKSNELIGVVNLNFMFPIHKSLIYDLLYEDIHTYRSFSNEKEKSKYIDLMQIQLKEINKLPVAKNAKIIYDLKYYKPKHPVSKRCFDFKKLESACAEYTQNMQNAE
ncbi:MAG: type III toxin-antitoxin system ToxN/AbiQ family toxin [Defluviitaleaceae bacterium]|nr:type III toxin-antitoxin system ToxN/AbiQ family toxin [Defluviitaleaceae bacterium]